MIAAFHAQQAAEMAIKSFLVIYDVLFPFTHRIGLLLELCEEFADWPAKHTDANSLTKYAVSMRYPGLESQLTQCEVIAAIKTSNSLLNEIANDLKHVGITFDSNI